MQKNLQDYIDAAPIGFFQWRLYLLCFLCALLDGFDTQAIAYTGPSIAKAFGLAPKGGLAGILMAGTIGMMVGAMTLGPIGDRLGRKPAILSALFLFGISSLATGFATTPEHVVVLRFLAGLGMGGMTPVLLSLVAEYSPVRRRGTVMTGILLGLPAGAMLGGLLASSWLPAIGWEGIFFAGGAAPLVLLVVAGLLLPESPHFLVAQDQERNRDQIQRLLERTTGERPAPSISFLVPARLEKSRVSALLAPEWRLRTLAIWTTYFFNWIAWYMLLLWLPTVLISAGLATERAALGTVTVNGVFIACAIPLSITLARLDVRGILLAMFACGVATCLALAFAAGNNWTLVFVLVGATGFGVGGQQIALNYLIANVYPTSLRATGTGWAIGMGRVGSIIGSAAGGWFLQTGGITGYYVAIAIPLLVAALAVGLIRIRKEPVGREALSAAH
ncbi:MFS transporter [Azospirillum melinis]|uniref:MFS transporter n=1 Tax=Azospirillum melinis TaxID=328839 RepID=A0ABX2KGE5_9PROT|nr:MFS transporter [Azospirillum melinis]MBP2309541.1 AAHS family 4-hydroxybenzoate transporter-like MFS transporter [Azospirillum melinis]NUB02685.1 MFS transporter [Azospirillum melinis]